MRKGVETLEVVIGGDAVSGIFAGPAPAHVACVLDGRVIGTAPVVGDRFAAPLPGLVFGLGLEVIDPLTGRQLLPVVLDFRVYRAVVWGGWSVVRRVLSGHFTISGASVSAELVPVELLISGRLCGTAFARNEGGIYRFSAPVPVLPPLGEPLDILPRIGGHVLPVALAVSAEACGVVGYIDETVPQVRGWACSLTAPGTRQSVELRVEGRAVATVVAQAHRADVEALGLGDGRSAFVIPYPKHLPRDRDVEIGVVLAGTETHLTHSPFIRPAPPPYAGYFDVVEGPFAGGWVVNMHDPETPLVVEAICGGEIVGTGTANLYRGDVESAGLPTARCGFRFLLERPMAKLIERDIVMRIKGTAEILQGSPRQVSQNENITRFLGRSALPAPVVTRLSRRMAYQTRETGVSIIMPVYNPRREWLIEAVNSVLQQWSQNWELICIDDGSTDPHVAEILDAAAKFDPRIRVLRPGRNQGIARAVNYGLRAARGAYVAFMDHDDVIEPDAVYRLAQAGASTRADLVYSDEAITTDDINSVVEVRARPAFSWDYYLSHPYFVHLIAVRTEVARQVTGYDESLPISADVDFVLRVIEAARVVTHVPAVLYRWRTHGSSTGHSKAGQVTATMLGALQRHLDRQLAGQGRAAVAREGLRFNEYRIDWPDDGGEILIVIPTKNRVDLLKVCIDSIERTSEGANYRIVVIDHQSDDPKTLRYLARIKDRVTVMPYAGPFNYAAMNNAAVRAHGGASKYVLFLNNDVEATEAGWLPRLRSLAARPEVGAVGPLLLYGDDRVQHAGVLVGFSGAADHAMKFVNAYLSKGSRHPGYNCNLTSVRDYSAVTAACVMIRMDVFQAVSGFDERFVVGFNDTDLCLRIGDAGYRVLYDGFTVLYHHESATRTQSKAVEHPEDDTRLRTRWKRFFTQGDPYYSPLLAPKGTDHTLRVDDDCKGRMQPRPIRLGRVAKPGRRVRPPSGRS